MAFRCEELRDILYFTSSLMGFLWTSDGLFSGCVMDVLQMFDGMFDALARRAPYGLEPHSTGFGSVGALPLSRQQGNEADTLE